MFFLAVRNLVVEKTRFAFSAAGIGFAVFLMTILLGLYQGWNSKIGGWVGQVDADAWVVREGATDFLNAASILPTEKVEELESSDAVAHAYPIIVRPMLFYNGDKETVMHLVGYDADGLDSPGGPSACDKDDCQPSGDEIVVDEALARTRDVDIGDILRTGNEEIEVVGYSKGGNFAFTTAGFMDFDVAQKFLEMDGLATFILVQLEPDADIDSWIRIVEGSDPVIEVYTQEEFTNNTRDRILKNILPIMVLIVGIAFVVGIAITSLTIFTTTVEKTKEFAVMKAIGFNNTDLFQLVVFQSFLIGLLGFVFGAILTLILSSFIDRIVPQFIVAVRWQDMLMVLGATLLMAFGAAIMPARRVGGLDPAAVFRG
jgi:putative ABC transport system permease protein